MTKKSRKSRLKRKRRGNLQPLVVKEASQSPQVLPLSPKQASAAKSPVTADEQAALHQYVLSDVRRSLTIAAVIFVILIALYFLLR